MTKPARRLSISSAVSLLERWRPNDEALPAQVAHLLRSMDPSAELELHPTDVSVLTQIYTRRVARSPDGVQGDRDLLEHLEAYARDEVLSCAITTQGVLVGLFFADDLSGVVGCVLGPDRRSRAQP